MPSVAVWEPFSELGFGSLRDEIDRFFGRGLSGTTHRWIPPMDVLDMDDAVVIKGELPGMTTADIDIECDADVLTIRGERRFEEEVDKDRQHRIERSYGSFERTFRFPHGVDPAGISAAFKDGVLEIRVPKTEDVKPRKVAITSGV